MDAKLIRGLPGNAWIEARACINGREQKEKFLSKVTSATLCKQSHIKFHWTELYYILREIVNDGFEVKQEDEFYIVSGWEVENGGNENE